MAKSTARSEKMRFRQEESLLGYLLPLMHAKWELTGNALNPYLRPQLHWFLIIITASRHHTDIYRQCKIRSQTLSVCSRLIEQKEGGFKMYKVVHATALKQNRTTCADAADHDLSFHTSLSIFTQLLQITVTR
jgi:hypothetical protein